MRVLKQIPHYLYEFTPKKHKFASVISLDNERLTMIRLLACFLVFTMAYIAEASTWYVNGSTGNDNKNDGKTPAKPFKTIQKALSLIKGSDEIVIEGKQGNKEIVYHESIYLDISKFGIKIKGQNSPVLDGSKPTADSLLMVSKYCGIYAESNLVGISGLTIRNFSYEGWDTTGVYGAGIYLASGSSRNVVTGNTVVNCNWGIYLDGNSQDIVEDNSVTDIKTDGNGRGGTAICIAPGGIGIESNVIGETKGNLIKGAEKYGICLGGTGAPVNADNCSVAINTIEDCKVAGLAVFNIEGIVNVTKNKFSANGAALLIGGMPIDTRFTDNKFNGSEGESEIIASPEYDGYLLFDIWKRNGNRFAIPTFAAVNPDTSKEEVIIGARGGFIRNRENAAEEDAAGRYRVMESK